MATAENNLSSSGGPLRGRRVVITRARSQAAAFAAALEEQGAEVIEFPTIEIVAPRSYEPLDRAIRQIETYHWVVFTSVNGVAYFFARWRQSGRPIADLRGIKVAAIGPQTAKALQQEGVQVDLVPAEFRAEAILKELEPAAMRGKRVLLPRAAQARDILPDTLREWGAEVDVIEAYRTVRAADGAEGHQGLLESGRIDMIAFTSSSTVVNFAALLPDNEMKGLLSGVAVACIGPITQKTAEELGIRVDVVSRDYTIPGLTKAIVEYFSRSGK